MCVVYRYLYYRFIACPQCDRLSIAYQTLRNSAKHSYHTLDHFNPIVFSRHDGGQVRTFDAVLAK